MKEVEITLHGELTPQDLEKIANSNYNPIIAFCGKIRIERISLDSKPIYALGNRIPIEHIIKHTETKIRILLDQEPIVM